SIAYQGSGRSLDAAEIEQLSTWATRGLLPDLTVVLDLDPALARGRLSGEPDRLEREGAEFFGRVRQAFLERAATDPGRYLVLDAAQPADAVAAVIRARVAADLGVEAPAAAAAPAPARSAPADAAAGTAADAS